MSLWSDIINDEDGAVLEGENEVLAPLLDEINLIQNRDIRNFVRSILLRAGVFWEIPSSFSGKHHPPDEHDVGGNVLHTKRVVRIAKFLCLAQERDNLECDIMFAAALLHDLTKGILWEDGTIAYDPLHPVTADKFVERIRHLDEASADELASSTVFVEDELVFYIMRMVRCSHGGWSPVPELIPVSQMEWILHFSDYLATNLHLITDGELFLERWLPTTEPLPEATPGP